MTEALHVIPSNAPVSTGVRDTETLAKALGDVLADTLRLTFKTQVCHWNIEGPLFHATHVLTEEQYGAMFAAADALAERIRALGHLAPQRLDDIVKRARIDDAEGGQSAEAMIAALAEDHERLAHRLHAMVDLSEGRKDPVTADLATQRSAFHEQAAWMLRALVRS
ncbi:Dps family protein [Maliponia aquimaris]|uniref:DNA protection during starvation protein 2 n=1 Tax=Maliponia aquimaris TaxID=1673631 RepID=A0A238L137_9RHOB|nr:DNA starvation/stationary phase protection protein [Maliponia aquimaris]SMX48707.1 DNA protection during starvation protein 2 [Maliponia aquimaris]